MILKLISSFLLMVLSPVFCLISLRSDLERGGANTLLILGSSVLVFILGLVLYIIGKPETRQSRIKRIKKCLMKQVPAMLEEDQAIWIIKLVYECKVSIEEVGPLIFQLKASGDLPEDALIIYPGKNRKKRILKGRKRRRKPFSRWSLANVGCFSPFFNLLALLVFLLGYGYAREVNFLTGLGIIFISIVFASLGLVMRDLKFQRIQLGRNVQAQRVFEQLKRPRPGQSRPVYNLYLRPFMMDGSAAYKQKGMISLIPGTEAHEIYGFEEWMSNLIDPMGFLLGLEKPEIEESPGVGRVAVKFQWKENVSMLAKYAEAIFVVPAYTRGTIWEIEWLKKNFLLGKTIFIMPPKPEGGMNNKGGINMINVWNRAKEQCLDIMINLPPYREEGMIFSIDQKGNFRGCGLNQLNIFAGHIITDLLDLAETEERKGQMQNKMMTLC